MQNFSRRMRSYQPRFLYDTEALIALKGSVFDGAGRRRGDFAMSILTADALRREHARANSRIIGHQAIERLLSEVPALELPLTAPADYAAIMLAYEEAGTTIDEDVAWVAAHAKAGNFVLLAEDPGRYQFVPGLRVLHWATDLMAMAAHFDQGSKLDAV